MRAFFGVVLAMAVGCGSESAMTLVDVASEPAGANCPEGGSAIHSGADDNDDGVLNADEIEITSYACNPEVILRSESEPVGPNCPNGGSVVHSGADDNGNAMLDDEEIDETTYICAAIGGVLDDNFTIETELDVAVLGTFVEITGDLFIVGPLATVTATNLKTIAGEIYVRSATVTDVSFPVLEFVGNGLFVETPCNELLSFSAPSLTTVEGDTWFEGCRKLASINLDALVTTVGGYLNVVDLDALTELKTPAMTYSDRLIVGGNALLQSVEAPLLVELDDDLEFIDNPVLSEFDLGALDIVGGDVTITANPMLPCTDAGALVLQLGTYLGTTTITGCEP